MVCITHVLLHSIQQIGLKSNIKIEDAHIYFSSLLSDISAIPDKRIYRDDRVFTLYKFKVLKPEIDK